MTTYEQRLINGLDETVTALADPDAVCRCGYDDAVNAALGDTDGSE